MAVKRVKRRKTEFGIEVMTFTAETGISIKELAARSGVKYVTLLEAMVGKSPGHELVPIVRMYMLRTKLQAQAKKQKKP